MTGNMARIENHKYASRKPSESASTSHLATTGTVEAFRNGAYEDKLNIVVVDALESHSAMADQALRHEKVFKGLANLLVEEVYRQLRGDAVQSFGVS